MFCLSGWIGGAHNFKSGISTDSLSPGARALVEKAFSDVDSKQLVDYHVHVVAVGTTCKECFIHPAFYSKLHPIKHMRFKVYASASGITDMEKADEQYLTRLNEVIDGIPNHGRYVILGFDKHYNSSGQAVPEFTDFYVSNEYSFQSAARYPGNLIPAISVHPDRADAVAELEKWAKKGARVVKWLPNAQGIDPADKRYTAFYQTMKKYKMILLTHGGEERAVDAGEFQELGNPLHLRLPLDIGVKVIVAHCASLGTGKDLDTPGQPQVHNFTLLLRLLTNKKYDGLVFSDISALTQFNRVGEKPEPETLAYVLNHPELHSKLVNGSDYPLPAINIVIRTGTLQKLGFITKEERQLLNEIYKFNPLIFDYVLKRTVRSPDDKNKGFSKEIFVQRRGLEPFG